MKPGINTCPILLSKINMKFLINRLPKKFKWTIHNVIAHPLSEIAHLIGVSALSEKIHDCTIPDNDLQENISDILNPERDD